MNRRARWAPSPLDYAAHVSGGDQPLGAVLKARCGHLLPIITAQTITPTRRHGPAPLDPGWPSVEPLPVLWTLGGQPVPSLGLDGIRNRSRDRVRWLRSIALRVTSVQVNAWHMNRS